MTPDRRTSTLLVIIAAAIALAAPVQAQAEKTATIHGAVLCYAGYGDGIEIGTVVVQPTLECPSGVSETIGTTSTGEWVFSFPAGCLGGYTSVTFLGETTSMSVPLGATVAFPYWREYCDGDPFPGTSDAPKVLYSPGASLTYTVTVRDIDGDPVDGALVRLEPTAAADAAIYWCSGQSHTPSGTTNYLGEASFQIAAGGCIDPARLGDDAFEISAEYAYVPGYSAPVALASRGATSSDAVNLAGLLPTDPSHQPDSGSGQVGLADAVFHTPGITSGVYEYCTDFNDDGEVTLSDAVILTGEINTGPACTLE